MKKPKLFTTDKRKSCLVKILLIMKLTTAFFLINFLSLQAVTYPQTKKLSLSLENVTVKEVFSTIEAQSNYRFLYNEKSIENQYVTIKSENGTIDNILAEVLSKTGSSYRMLENNLIVITPKTLLNKQELLVSGKVTDASGSPLPGVNIVEKGTINGAITDVDGKYSITVASEKSILIFSFIGYLSEEVEVGTNSSIDMVLSEDIQRLDEVVVIGYGTVKKSDLTGSVSSVGSKEIEQGTVTNTLQAMQGRAAGVDITSNNRPGEMGTIRIRGERSITGGANSILPTTANDPLYVIDGIPMPVSTRRLNTEPVNTAGTTIYENYMNNPIADINPNDIESIEILKDASATAIYGSRGANGVVIVTTKRGQSGQAKITYDGSVTFDKMDDRVKMFDAAGQFEAMREGWRHPQTGGAYATPYPSPRYDYMIIGLKDPNSWESIAMGYEWVDKAARIPVMRTTTAEEQALWGVTEVPVYDPSKVRNTDWKSMAIGTGITQNHQVAASAGTDKIKSYFSFGYLDQKGIEKGQGYKRYSALISLDMNVNKRVRLGGSINGVVADQDFGPNTYNLARGMLPFTVPYDTAGNFIWLPGNEATIVNFLKDVDNVINNRKTYSMRGSFYGEIDLFKGLKYRINFGPDYRQYRNGTFQGAESSTRYGGASPTSYARYLQNSIFNWTLDNLLYYDATISDIHTIGITLLQSAEQNRFEDSHLSAENLPYDSQLWYDLKSARTGVAKDWGSQFESQQRVSYMARVNYSLMDKYLVTFSGRRDGASVLAAGHKWDFFPSAAFAWKMHEESFLKKLDFITEAKLRLGWGVSGNSLIPPYMAMGSLGMYNYAWGSTSGSGWKIKIPPNADLGWEKTAQTNLGLDLGFFNNRLKATIDLYDARTSDLLMPRNILDINGASSVYFNIGKTRNKGIEIMISTVNISNSNLSWRTDFTFASNRNEIVELYNGKNDDLANKWFIGEPISVNYGYLYDGIWQDTPEDNAKRAAYGSVFPYPGSIRVKDIDTVTTSNKIDAFDMLIRGTPYPDFITGMTNYITYKGFELSFFLYARVGQTIDKPIPLLYGRYPDIAVDYWTPTNTGAEYPRPNYASGITDPFMSTLNYQKGSFLKVRNISLSYNIPKSLLSKVNMANLSINFQLLNPILITNAVNVDPDYFGPTTSSSGNATKSFVIGVKAGF